VTLSVVSSAFLTTLAALTVGSWAGWRLLRRRRPVSAVAVLVLSLVLSTASVASAVNTYFTYAPRVRDVVSLVGGTPGGVLRLRVPDRGSGFGASEALVWLPPQYAAEPTRRFPVVYLFHGSPGVPADWFRGGEAAEAAAALARAGAPLILVAPRMSHGWLDDPECVDGAHERVETHFVRDVVPAVDTSLRTVAARSARVVGGMSAGGYCALNLGLRNRALVSAIIDMSGDVAPTHAGGLAPVFGPGPGLAFGARANSPAAYATTLAPSPTTRVWFDCGTSDTALLRGIRRISAVLAARGFPVVVRVRPGGHTFRVWRPALAESLAWASGR